MKTSKIWKLDKDEFQNLVNNCSSLKEVLLKLELVPVAGNYQTLGERIRSDLIDLTVLNSLKSKKRKTHGRYSKKENDDIFIENSKSFRGSVKDRIVKQKLIPYQCKCGISDTWNGEKLVLVLDHINGVNDDNRLSNLRFLCPNCNSQTSTFSGRNVKSKSHTCPVCSLEFSGHGKQCKSCWLNNQPKKFKVSCEDLKKLILEEKKNFSEIGCEYGVSGNTVKKLSIKYGII